MGIACRIPEEKISPIYKKDTNRTIQSHNENKIRFFQFEYRNTQVSQNIGVFKELQIQIFPKFKYSLKVFF